MGQTVNLLAYAFGGSNPSLPTKFAEVLRVAGLSPVFRSSENPESRISAFRISCFRLLKEEGQLRHHRISDQTENTVAKHDCILGQRSNNTWPSKQAEMANAEAEMANAAIILWQVIYAAGKKPGQDFVPMINLLLPTTLQPTFRTDPGFLYKILHL